MKQIGFSLLELLVALAVATILLTLCLPGYRAQTEQLHRLAAEAKLLTWQLGGDAPVDRYYVYSQSKMGGVIRWQAYAVGVEGPCKRLTLTLDQRLPADCWCD